MEKRIKFLKGRQREFLLKVQNRSGLEVSELAEIAHVTSRSYRDWKREKLNMTLKAALEFSSKYEIELPETIGNLVTRWKKYKIEIGRRGGIECFRKHGSPSTLEGMRKGGAKTLSILRQKGIISYPKEYKFPEVYSEELAELIGISLGDGGITTGQICITLNGEKDKEYVEFVSNLGKSLFGEMPRIYERKSCNAITVSYNSESLVKYLVKIGLKIGNKVKQQVGVPEWIEASRDYRIACLRGLMDTDGGVFIHKYKVNKKHYNYKKICFTNRSLPLLIFVKETLEELGFTPKLIQKVENKKVWLYNEQEVKNYMRIVGSHNERLLKQVAIL